MDCASRSYGSCSLARWLLYECTWARRRRSGFLNLPALFPGKKRLHRSRWRAGEARHFDARRCSSFSSSLDQLSLGASTA